MAISPVVLPRIPANWLSMPGYFTRIWNTAMTTLEQGINGVIQAQNTADQAQTTATQAETDAQAAAAAAAAAQATANSKQDHSTTLDLYAAGDIPSVFTLGIVDSPDALSWRTAIGAGTSSTTGTVTSVNVSGGTTGLAFSGGPVTSSGTITLGGTLGVANGGTGVTTSTGSGSLVLSASPALTGTPTAPTAAAATNTTQIATTAFVEGEIATFKSGTYTPTFTANTNVSSSVAYSAQWMQIGKVVTVSGRVDITATAGNANTKLNVSLPVASSFTALENAAGTMASLSLGTESGVVHAVAAGTTAQLDFQSANSAATGYYFQFTYRILP